mmetsp:Transcript_34152/g.101526  ORF Transcript_34152/g.101526 Transcript_34152/m.101526 type:complete len:286 (+) Transcript_34152:156-1013(+)
MPLTSSVRGKTLRADSNTQLHLAGTESSFRYAKLESKSCRPVEIETSGCSIQVVRVTVQRGTCCMHADTLCGAPHSWCVELTAAPHTLLQTLPHIHCSTHTAPHTLLDVLMPEALDTGIPEWSPYPAPLAPTLTPPLMQVHHGAWRRAIRAAYLPTRVWVVNTGLRGVGCEHRAERNRTAEESYLSSYVASSAWLPHTKTFCLDPMAAPPAMPPVPGTSLAGFELAAPGGFSRKLLASPPPQGAAAAPTHRLAGRSLRMTIWRFRIGQLLLMTMPTRLTVKPWET